MPKHILAVLHYASAPLTTDYDGTLTYDEILDLAIALNVTLETLVAHEVITLAEAKRFAQQVADRCGYSLIKSRFGKGLDLR